MNPYQVLGVSHDAGLEELRRAYRRQVRYWHPDRFDDPDERKRAEERIKEVNAAWREIRSAVEVAAKSRANTESAEASHRRTWRPLDPLDGREDVDDFADVEPSQGHRPMPLALSMAPLMVGLGVVLVAVSFAFRSKAGIVLGLWSLALGLIGIVAAPMVAALLASPRRPSGKESR